MKLFILKATVFLAIFLGFFAIEEIVFRSIPNNVSYKYEYLTDNASNIKILILGSSIEEDGIRPSQFKVPTFNAAISAKPPEMDHAILLHFWEQLDSLQVLIMPLSYFSLHHNDTSSQVEYVNYITRTDLDINPKPIRNYSAMLTYQPHVVHRNVMRKIRDPQYTHITVDTLGWDRLGKSFGALSPEETLQNATFYARNNNQKCNNDTLRNLQYYQEIIELCQERNVTVLLLSVPMTDLFINAIDTSQLNYVRSKGRYFSEHYSNVVYLDMFQSPLFDYSDFGNVNHLNPKGAEKFTAILDSIIENHILN